MIVMTLKSVMTMVFVKIMTPKMATAVTVRLASQEKTVKQWMYAIQTHANTAVYVHLTKRELMEGCVIVLKDTTAQHVTLRMRVGYSHAKMEGLVVLMTTLKRTVIAHQTGWGQTAK
jgi:hypothetical protein